MVCKYALTIVSAVITLIGNGGFVHSSFSFSQSHTVLLKDREVSEANRKVRYAESDAHKVRENIERL